jgi:hypothetical protein
MAIDLKTIFIIIYTFLISYYLIFLYSPYFYLRSTGSNGRDFVTYQLYYIVAFLGTFAISLLGFHTILGNAVGFSGTQVLAIFVVVVALIYYFMNVNNLNTPGKYNYFWFNNEKITLGDGSWKRHGITQKSFGETYPERLDTPLMNLSVCSSYHSPMFTKMFMTDKPVVSPSAIVGVINKGARFIHMDVFGDSVRYFANPVVGIAREYTNDLVSVNTFSFESACNAILQARNGNNVCPGMPGDDNGRSDAEKKDPLFVYLRMKTDNRQPLEDKIADIISYNFSEYLLNLHYSENLGSQELRTLLGKIVIITDRKPVGEKMRALVNGVACGKNLTEFSDWRRKDNPSKTAPNCNGVDINSVENADTTIIEIFNESGMEASNLATAAAKGRSESTEVASGYKHLTICVPNYVDLKDFYKERVDGMIKLGVNFPCVPFSKKYTKITGDYFTGYKEYTEDKKTFKDCGILIKSPGPDTSIARTYIQGEIEVSERPDAPDTRVITAQTPFGDSIAI